MEGLRENNKISIERKVGNLNQAISGEVIQLNILCLLF